MSVTRAKRGTGIGTRLLTALVEWAYLNRISRLELEVFSNNVRAVRFYEKAGFVVEGRRTQAVEIGGDLLDILLMAKTL